MTWQCIRKPFQEGVRMTLGLQEEFLAAYTAHVRAGRGLLPNAAVFVRSDAPGDSYEFYFTPDAAELMGALLDKYGAVNPCEAPVRAEQGNRRRGAVSLIVGEQTAWDLVK